MSLSKEQLETIWRVLYPDKDPYKHSDTIYQCVKCMKMLASINSQHRRIETGLRSKPCSIPDKLTKSLAEVAEDIRIDVMKLGYDYYDMWEDEICKLTKTDRFGKHAIAPLDKITAFCKIQGETK